VNDRTEQHASSVRNRRASKVREQSQSEREQATSRVIVNNNHMHALTMVYYEVVQTYRVVARMHAVQRVLFIPFDLLDFSGADASELIARYRGPLLAAAITPRIRNLLLDETGQVEIRGAIRVEAQSNAAGMVPAGLVANPVTLATGHAPAAGGSGTVPPPAGSSVVVVRRGPVADSLPGNAMLVRISFEGVGVDRVRLDQPAVSASGQTLAVSPASDQVMLADGIRVATIGAIQVATADGAEDAGTMTLHCEVDGRPAGVAIPLVLGSGMRMQTVAFIDADPSDRKGELLAHLQANRAYYTRAVLRRLDAASLAMMLSPYSWMGRPLADQVEPVPVTVAGNYLVLRAPAEGGDLAGFGGVEDSWAQVLEDRDIGFEAQDIRLIPIPTGGVFAEAGFAHLAGADGDRASHDGQPGPRRQFDAGAAGRACNQHHEPDRAS
jgi:hypothetical protein